jgi:hypothetical protein
MTWPETDLFIPSSPGEVKSTPSMEKTMPHDASESLVPGLANGAVIGKEPICFETILSNFPVLFPFYNPRVMISS